MSASEAAENKASRDFPLDFLWEKKKNNKKQKTKKTGSPKLTDIQGLWTFVTHTAFHEHGSEEDTPVYR